MQQKIAAASEGYRHISGYRQVGLKADDIIDSENHLVELVRTALTHVTGKSSDCYWIGSHPSDP